MQRLGLACSISSWMTRACVRAMSHSSALHGREFSVPVPWGRLSGREWGDPSSGTPWIALHGWLDNCGSFDALAPRFPAGHRLLCVDMPGHGLSSHNPKGQLLASKGAFSSFKMLKD